MPSTFSLTNLTKDNIHKHFWRTASWTKPAAIFFGLFTVAPTEVGGGTEVAGGAYARIALAPLDANYTAPATGSDSGRFVQNAGVITFAAPTADWGFVVAVGRFDALTVGNLEAWAPITIPFYIRSGDGPATFAAGGFVFNIP